MAPHIVISKNPLKKATHSATFSPFNCTTNKALNPRVALKRVLFSFIDAIYSNTSVNPSSPFTPPPPPLPATDRGFTVGARLLLSLLGLVGLKQC